MEEFERLCVSRGSRLSKKGRKRPARLAVVVKPDPRIPEEEVNPDPCVKWERGLPSRQGAEGEAAYPREPLAERSRVGPVVGRWCFSV